MNTYSKVASFQNIAWIAKCKIAVSPLLTHWRYCTLTLSHMYIWVVHLSGLLVSYIYYAFNHVLRSEVGVVGMVTVSAYICHLTSIVIPIMKITCCLILGYLYTRKDCLHIEMSVLSDCHITLPVAAATPLTSPSNAASLSSRVSPTQTATPHKLRSYTRPHLVKHMVLYFRPLTSYCCQFIWLRGH